MLDLMDGTLVHDLLFDKVDGSDMGTEANLTNSSEVASKDGMETRVRSKAKKKKKISLPKLLNKASGVLTSTPASRLADNVNDKASTGPAPAADLEVVVATDNKTHAQKKTLADKAATLTATTAKKDQDALNLAIVNTKASADKALAAADNTIQQD